MIYLIAGISIVLLIVGFVLTEGNAAYILNEPKNRLSMAYLRRYVHRFRNFQIALALSYFLFGSGIYYFIDENAAGVFMVAYPVLGYLWLIIALRKDRPASYMTYPKVALGGLAVTLILAGGIWYRSLTPNTVKFHEQGLRITGAYGMNLDYDEILSVALTDTLPSYRKKIHGYMTADILKGEFKLTNGTKVKFIVNEILAPYVRIETKDGRVVYLTDRHLTSSELVHLLSEKMTEPQSDPSPEKKGTLPSRSK